MQDVVSNKSSDLPAEIVLNHPNAYDIWVIWRALDRRFLPSQIIDEPEDLLTDMILLDSLYNAIETKANAPKTP